MLGAVCANKRGRQPTAASEVEVQLVQSESLLPSALLQAEAAAPSPAVATPRNQQLHQLEAQSLARPWPQAAEEVATPSALATTRNQQQLHQLEAQPLSRHSAQRAEEVAP